MGRDLLVRDWSDMLPCRSPYPGSGDRTPGGTEAGPRSATESRCMGRSGATLPRLVARDPCAGCHAALAAALARAVAAARSVRRVEVAGTSMSPALLAGDRLVVVALPSDSRPVARARGGGRRPGPEGPLPGADQAGRRPWTAGLGHPRGGRRRPRGQHRQPASSARCPGPRWSAGPSTGTPRQGGAGLGPWPEEYHRA